VNMRWIVIVAAVGCKGATPVAPPSGTASLPAAPVGFSTCDLVTFDPSGTVTTWAIEGGVKQLGSTVIGPALDLSEARAMAEPMHGDWADRGHLFIRTAKDTVKLVTAEGIAPVEIPDMTKLRPPKPEGEDARPTSEGMSFSAIDLVVRDGEAWWARCAWSFAYDGGYCGVWTSAQLWPRPRTMTKLADERRHAFPSHEPHGYAIESGERLTCTAPTGAKSEIAHGQDEAFYGTHWLSAEPPRLLVLFGPQAEFSSPPPSRWEIHGGCAAPALAKGESPSPGLGELWSATERDGIAIYRGATKLGQLTVRDPAFAQLRFRPGK
jgi:hypothetical protein